MMDKQPDLYGPKMPDHPAIICLFACWANLDGKPYAENKEAQEFFADMDHVTKDFQFVGKLIELMAGKAMPTMDYKTPHTLSEMTATFDFPARVEPNPYYSACWCGTTQNLTSNGFAKWAAETTAQVQARDGCYATFQWCVSGGKYSKMLTNGATNPIALGHRDIKLLCFLYIHYDNTTALGAPWADPRKYCEGWVHKVSGKAIGPQGIIGTSDRRWMAFPCGPTSDDNLDRTWRYYFDDEAAYRRVLATKRQFDPDGVFSANMYCVGANKDA
jgi:hypothetical protein